MGAGGIRSSLQKGDVSLKNYALNIQKNPIWYILKITYGGVLTVFPFEGTMDKVFISGATILSALEHSARVCQKLF